MIYVRPYRVWVTDLTGRIVHDEFFKFARDSQTDFYECVNNYSANYTVQRSIEDYEDLEEKGNFRLPK